MPADDAAALLPANESELLENLLFQSKQTRIRHGIEQQSPYVVAVIAIAVQLTTHSRA